MLEALLNLLRFETKQKSLVVDPSDIEYCPVRQETLSPRKYVKQRVITTLPPIPATFNEVYTNVYEQLRK